MELFLWDGCLIQMVIIMLFTIRQGLLVTFFSLEHNMEHEATIPAPTILVRQFIAII